MKKIIIGFIVLSVVISLIIPLNNRSLNTKDKEITNLKKTNDSLLKVMDSIKSDIFVKDIQIGRYEYILDRAEEEMSPECRKQLEKIYGETE